MKRSKIFLGLTGGLLATVAFVSAKARFISTPVAYLKNGVCTVDPRDWKVQTIQNGPQSFTTVGSVHYNLFTNITGALSCTDGVYPED